MKAGVVASIAVALAACGRLGFDDADLQSTNRDAAVDTVTIDGAPQLRETLVVPADGTPIPSVMPLAAGKGYLLRVTGTFYIAGGTDPYCDAEYWDFSAGAKDLCDDMVTDAGLSIDDPTVDAMKLPKWGAYNPAHIYTADVIGSGAPISAKIHDVAPGNNTGSLTLEIFEY